MNVIIFFLNKTLKFRINYISVTGKIRRWGKCVLVFSFIYYLRLSAEESEIQDVILKLDEKLKKRV